MFRLEDIPQNILRAGEHAWLDLDIETPFSAFAERWGGLENENFLRAFLEGQDEDRLFAIFVLPSQLKLNGKELIYPLLESSVREERWASAISLGDLHDERVFLRLQELLLEGLDIPTLMSPNGPGRLWYYMSRSSIITLLSGASTK